jgi:predicted aconitase
MVVTPIEERFSTTASDSGKACSYLPTLCGQKVVYRTTDGILEMIS